MNADDPKLTAYALGQLGGEEEARLAAEISKSPELERVVAETRELAQMLQGEYASERAAEPIRSANLIDIRDDRWFWGVGRSLALAAAIALFAVIGAIALSNYQKNAAQPRLATKLGLPAPGPNLPLVQQSPADEAEVLMNPLDLVEPIPAPAAPGAALRHGSQIVMTGTPTPPPVDITTNKAEKLEMGNRSLVRAQVLDPIASRPAGQAGAENAFVSAAAQPRSTFPFHVPTASYGALRDALQRGSLPPAEQVRLEEMLNSFSYDYPEPAAGKAFSINLEAAVCPWDTSHRIVRVGLKARGNSGENATIAKDLNVEVGFNPARVASYRLLGYERRGTSAEAATGGRADILAGQTATALYEILLAPAVANVSASALTVKLHYQPPGRSETELGQDLSLDAPKNFDTASADLKFAAAVAEFGMLLLNSEHKGNGTLGAVLEWAEQSKGADANGQRAVFIELVRKAHSLTKS